MITQISVRGYKSFHPTQNTSIVLNAHTPPLPVFFYGINGAGKSAIGEVIQGVSSADARFANCVVKMSEGLRPLVYNQTFVDRVIRSKGGAPGIFTLGTLDAATEKEIEEREAELAALDAERASLQTQIEASRTAGVAVLEVAMTEVWKAHVNLNKSPLYGLLDGYHKDRRKFLDQLNLVQVADDAKLDTLEELEARLADASSDDGLQIKMALNLSGLAEIESDAIWSEAIEISGESRLAALIEKIGNSDWVGEGRQHIHGEECPFCQQKLPADFTKELAILLDGARQQKVDRVVDLADQYTTRVNEIGLSAKAILAHSFASQEAKIGSAWAVLQAQLGANVAAMQRKSGKPTEPVLIASVDIDPLMDAVQKANERIDEFNKRVSNRGVERDRVKEILWKVLRRDRSGELAAYAAHRAPYVDALVRDKSLDAIAAQKQQILKAKLQDLRKKQTGVDAAVAGINDRLSRMGITGYSIARKKGEGSLYCLARPDQGQGEMTSLSEGEKTLISFFYYLELLAGSESEEAAVVDIKRTIAVIDDPISSLSHNFVFDIASVIHRELINPPDGQPRPRQVILLTHNLFFLHELLRQLGVSDLAKANKRCQLLRVSKNEHTQVDDMKPNELMNDYQALWQILRDARTLKVPAVMVPNAMRCILEHFFWFTHQESKFKEVLDAISGEDNKFAPLARYLDRGSHKDGINISVMDFSQYDLNYYFGKFESVFEKAGFSDHYRSNIGEAPTPALAIPTAVV